MAALDGAENPEGGVGRNEVAEPAAFKSSSGGVYRARLNMVSRRRPSRSVECVV